MKFFLLNLNNFTFIMSCKAVIKFGKNAGKICGRFSCNIKGHEKYVEGIGKCKNIIKIGKNKDLECGRINCKIHTNLPKNFNIAKYVNLPEYFINIVKNNKFFTRKLNIKCFSIYEKHIKLNKDKKECISDIQTILYDTENTFNINNKMILIIFINKLLDTPNMNWFINKNEKFKKVVEDKIIIHQNIDFLPEFSEYFKNNFEINKRYISIDLNKDFRKKILKKYIFSLIVFYSIYRNMIHNRYKPGGIGYYECEKRFYENCIQLKKLKLEN